MVNVCNFTRSSGDTPALLRLEEAETLFHEFGHGLHALLSQHSLQEPGSACRGTSSSCRRRSWSTGPWSPQVLKMYARHWQTGEPIPGRADRRRSRRRSGSIRASPRSSIWRPRSSTWTGTPARTVTNLDATAFEKAALEKIGLIPEIVTRYRSPYFQHIFAGGYSAGYYSYIWSEVLDTDAFEAFKEKRHLRRGDRALLPHEHPRTRRHRGRYGDVQGLPGPGAFGRAVAGETRPEASGQSGIGAITLGRCPTAIRIVLAPS